MLKELEFFCVLNFTPKMTLYKKKLIELVSVHIFYQQFDPMDLT